MNTKQGRTTVESDQPILDTQPGDASEMVLVARHQCQVVGKGDCGDLDVSKHQGLPLRFKVCAQSACDVGRLGIKIQDIDGRQQHVLKVADVVFGAVAFVRAVDNLRDCYGAGELHLILQRQIR